MSRAEFFGGSDSKDYMKVADVRNGQILTIQEFFVNHSGLGRKPCLKFQETGEKILTLNQTNYDFLMGQWGDDEYVWHGKQVAVSIEQVRNPNEKGTTPGIRFKRVPEEKTAL